VGNYPFFKSGIVGGEQHEWGLFILKNTRRRGAMEPAAGAASRSSFTFQPGIGEGDRDRCGDRFVVAIVDFTTMGFSAHPQAASHLVEPDGSYWVRLARRRPNAVVKLDRANHVVAKPKR